MSKSMAEKIRDEDMRQAEKRGCIRRPHMS